MRLSKKCDYALRALCSLTESYEKEPTTIKDLADANDIPKRFLEHIMIEMKEKGWVRSVPGRYGGYMLAIHPSEITLGDVIRHFDDFLAPIGCVSVFKCNHCSQETTCKFRGVLSEIRNITARLADGTTLASIVRSTKQL